MSLTHYLKQKLGILEKQTKFYEYFEKHAMDLARILFLKESSRTLFSHHDLIFENLEYSVHIPCLKNKMLDGKIEDWI